MCGICGFTGKPDRKLLKEMATRIKHRGPDVCGILEDASISLACQRLRIRDRTARADQPMTDSEGSVIVYNGEIYNDGDLRDELAAAGHRFSTESDTETVLAAYREWGDDCFARLDGMFAVALWDPSRKRLVLSRDTFGIKPLYYLTTQDNRLYFSSELKSLLPVAGKRLNPGALAAFYAFSCNPLDESLISGIFKVPPGSVLSWDGRMGLHHFPSFDKQSPQRMSAKHLLRILSQAVNASVADVDKVGLFLSGGVDSSLILALAHQSLGAEIRTYTARFPAFDESSDAYRIASHFSTHHSTIEITEDHLEILPEVIWYADAALGDPTAVPTYLLAREASKRSRVVLTGEGGDELFYGYEHIRLLYVHKHLVSPLPTGMKKIISRILPAVPPVVLNCFFPYTRDLGRKAIVRAQQFLLNTDALDQYLAMVSFFSPEERKRLGCEVPLDLKGKINMAKANSELDTFSRLNSAIFFTNAWLPKTDRMTMAHSIEGRLPYLINPVVEAAYALPYQEKIRLFTDKIALRRAARRVLPRHMVPRTKQRFFVPLNHLWGEGIQSRFVAAMDSESAEMLGIPRAYLEEIHQSRFRSPLYSMRQMWNLLSLFLWIHEFILENGDKPRRPGWW